MHAARVHERPRCRGQGQQNPPAVAPALHGQSEQCQRDHGEHQWPRRQLVGVERRDDRDGQKVIHDRQSQQEGAKRAGQVCGQHRQHRKREGDIGGDGHRPAVDVLRMACAEVDRNENGCGNDHSADGGSDRQRGARGITKVTGDEFTFELQPDHEEEDRQQSVGRPLRDAEPQMQKCGPIWKSDTA